jgi:hypothetical protein
MENPLCNKISKELYLKRVMGSWSIYQKILQKRLKLMFIEIQRPSTISPSRQLRLEETLKIVEIRISKKMNKEILIFYQLLFPNFNSNQVKRETVPIIPPLIILIREVDLFQI